MKENTIKTEAMISGDITDASSGLTTGAVVHKSNTSNLGDMSTPLKRFINKKRKKQEKQTEK